MRSRGCGRSRPRPPNRAKPPKRGVVPCRGLKKQIAKAAKGQTLAPDDYQLYGAQDFQQGVSSGAPIPLSPESRQSPALEAATALELDPSYG